MWRIYITVARANSWGLEECVASVKAVMAGTLMDSVFFDRTELTKIRRKNILPLNDRLQNSKSWLSWGFCKLEEKELNLFPAFYSFAYVKDMDHLAFLS